MSMSSNRSNRQSPRPVNIFVSIGYMSFGFLVIFFATYLIVFSLIRGGLQETREKLDRDLPARVREYSQSSTRVPVIGTRMERSESDSDLNVD